MMILITGLTVLLLFVCITVCCCAFLCGRSREFREDPEQAFFLLERKKAAQKRRKTKR